VLLATKERKAQVVQVKNMSSKRKRATRKDKDDEDDKKRKADTKPKVAKRGNSSNTKFSRKKLKDWFSSYTGMLHATPQCHSHSRTYTHLEDSNEIGPNGVEKFCKDLGIEPEDVSHSCSFRSNTEPSTSTPRRR
jgi:hypothetical protein